jgi:hypothetical protein
LIRLCAILLLVCAELNAVTVDRLAVTVGHTVITELQIDEELRVTTLLNGQPVSRDLESRRAAADRLVEQLLIQHEMDLSRYPAPTDEELDSYYNGVQQTLGGEERMRQLLTQYELTDQTLRSHLKAQLATLRFIEFRFRPDINISDQEITVDYKNEVAEMRASSPLAKVPSLDTAERDKLSQVLLEQRTDAALDTWLAESRKQVNIVYIDSALR